MSLISRMFYSTITAAMLISAAHNVSGMTLARNGRPVCPIVISASATAPEKTAARELAVYLKQVTGGDFKIKTESQVKATSPQILVGQSKRVKQLLPSVDWPGLGHDGIIIKTIGNRLVLAGGQPRGTLYAVYSFLEDTVGCRWWTGTESTIPSKRTLQVPELNTNYTPKLRYREAFYRDPLENPIFAAKLKLNGHFYNIPPAYGDHYKILGWCHTSYALLPPDKYFAQHPDWYSEINGKRDFHGAQLCLTNDEMRKELTRVALEWIKKDPTAGIISITQNDCHGACQCPKCKAVEQEEGSPSGPLIRFVNAVAADIEKQYPDMLVETLAYQYTRKPPLHVKPRHNVVVRLCSIECDFSKPLESDANASFRDDIRKWSAIAPNLYIWDYVTDFASYIQPQPNMRVLAPNLRFFVDNNTIGVFEQGDSATSVGDFVRLRAWVLGHLEWDPTRNPDDLIKEFVNGYYGPAAPYLLQYLNLVHDAVAKKNMRLSCYNGNLSFLTLADMNEATQLFAKAEAAVVKNPALTRRVRRERMPLDHVWLLRYDELKQQAEQENAPFMGPKNAAAACKEFIDLARAWKANNYSEGQSFESYVPSLESRFAPPPPSPEELPKVSSKDCVVLHENDFQLFNAPDWASIVDDAKASDGKAARMPGNHTQWAVQYHVTDELAKLSQGPWTCYLVARCDTAATSGGAFSYGLYNQPAGSGIVTMHENIRRASDGAYHTYYLGRQKLNAGMYFWVSPSGDGNAVKGVYVDRIVLVKGKK